MLKKNYKNGDNQVKMILLFLFWYFIGNVSETQFVVIFYLLFDFITSLSLGMCCAEIQRVARQNVKCQKRYLFIFHLRQTQKFLTE